MLYDLACICYGLFFTLTKVLGLLTLECVQVRELLHKRIREMYLNPQFGTDVLKPLNIEALIDQQVRTLTSFYGA